MVRRQRAQTFTAGVAVRHTIHSAAHPTQSLAFARVNLQYPPQPSEAETCLAISMGMTEREAEVLYYHGRAWPLDQCHCEEMLIDLGQSIHRARVTVTDRVPCIIPRNRLWKRRAKEWLLAPEAMLAQGLDSSYPPRLREFNHKQIMDLMGNAFNSCSYLTALATALAGVNLKRHFRERSQDSDRQRDGVRSICDGAQKVPAASAPTRQTGQLLPERSVAEVAAPDACCVGDDSDSN